MVVKLNETTVESELASRHPASFRDPSGFIYRGADGQLLRQINRSYRDDYRLFMDSGLYDQLVSGGDLVEHEEVSLDLASNAAAECVIRPRELPFISYPYEWAFSALQEAARLTLRIQKQALQAGLSLKDASAYNVQFEGTRPVFIDSLSFEQYVPGRPWSAYGQFCRHFLLPLALMARRDVRLGTLLRQHVDGIPLDLASKLLPVSTRLNLGLAVHLHLHARMVQRCGNTQGESQASQKQLSQQNQEVLLDNLLKTVEKLSWKPSGTEWADYYENNSYSDSAFEQKKLAVSRMLEASRPSSVWDLGANRGVFSRLATQIGAHTCSFDIDPACVEQNYLDARKEDCKQLLPLLLDLTNPTPAIGWNLAERESFIDRAPCDMVLALALIHHLAISNNVPLAMVAEHFSRLGKSLIIEFVPKQDPQVQRLLSTRPDIFAEYTQEEFEKAFAAKFSLVEREQIGDDGRVLYLMERSR